MIASLADRQRRLWQRRTRHSETVRTQKKRDEKHPAKCGVRGSHGESLDRDSCHGGGLVSTQNLPNSDGQEDQEDPVLQAYRRTGVQAYQSLYATTTPPEKAWIMGPVAPCVYHVGVYTPQSRGNSDGQEDQENLVVPRRTSLTQSLFRIYLLYFYCTYFLFL